MSAREPHEFMAAEVTLNDGEQETYSNVDGWSWNFDTPGWLILRHRQSYQSQFFPTSAIAHVWIGPAPSKTTEEEVFADGKTDPS